MSVPESLVSIPQKIQFQVKFQLQDKVLSESWLLGFPILFSFLNYMTFSKTTQKELKHITQKEISQQNNI